MSTRTQIDEREVMTDADRIAVIEVDGLIVGPAMIRGWRERIAELEAKITRYESMAALPNEPSLGDIHAMSIYANQLRAAVVTLKVKYESALDDALRKSQRYTEAAEYIEAMKAENESLRAECGLRQIQGYNEGKKIAEAALATARQEERERILPLLKKIARGPVLPLPDPMAHSWQTFGTRAHSALCDCMSLANEAIRALTDEEPK